MENLGSEKDRVLIIGCTGYIGRFITNASLRLGCPTYLLIRSDVSKDVYKAAMVINYKRSGAKLIEGSLDDHEGLVKALKQVDVVICSIAEKNIFDQLKLIKAIKQAGNIKRFLPSEYGMDPAIMGHAISPGDKVFKDKMVVRKAVEEAGVPYTCVSANCFAGYFVSGIAQLQQFFPPREKAVVYSDGHPKVIWVDEDDVGTYVLKAASDPRTHNKTVYIRPPENILSQLQVLNIWEKKIGKTLEKTYMTEEEILNIINDEEVLLPHRVALAHFYQIFYKGDLVFEIGFNGLDIAELYPDVPYTTVDSYLDRYI